MFGLRRNAKVFSVVLLLACLCCSCTGPARYKVGDVDLGRAVIVVPQSQGGHVKAAQMLADEFARRTGIRMPIVGSRPNTGTAIVLGTVESLRGTYTLPTRLTVPAKAEGYAIWVDTLERKPATVYLVGRDDRGALFAAGRLIRLANMTRGDVTISRKLRVATAPEYPIRGHQIGYRSLNNATDTWDLAIYEQHIRDLILFGTNSIELVPTLRPDKEPGYHMNKSMWEMNSALSEMIGSYGLDVWVWVKVMHEQIKTPEAEAEAMAKRKALFESFKHLDAVFVPGGDGGDVPPDILLPWLGRLAKVLHEVHPNAKLWVSNQTYEYEWNDTFFNYLQTEQPDWLEGVVFGPWTTISIPEVRRRTPSKYKLRRYPDITHCLGCQYPVPKWDRAFGLTHGREPVCPRPRQMAHIHNLYAPLTKGFISYSDGVHDDANKFLWSGLGWDSKADVREILREYGKAFFGDEHADTVADGLLMLEENWVGPIVENRGIEKTLAHWKGIGRAGTGSLSDNWRLQLHLFRATYDAYLRRKVLAEAGYEAEARKTLKQAGRVGAKAAIAGARSALAQADKRPAAPQWRKRIESLGLALFESIGFQISVKEPYKAQGPRRGAVLDYLDRPLNDRLWLEKEFAEILAEQDESVRLARIERILNWEDAGDGGFYDDLGSVGKQPHLVRQKDWEDDPGLMVAAIEENYYRKVTSDAKLSWLNQEQIRYRMGQHPPGDVMSAEELARIRSEKPPLLTMRYDDLDKRAKYRIRVTYHGRFRPENRLTADGKYEVHGPLVQPEPTRPVEFDIPTEATRDGTLELQWELLNKARGCQVAEVWLIKG